MRKLGVVAVLALAAASVVAGSASGASYARITTADAYVAADAPRANYGAALELRAGGGDVRSYLRFELAGVTGKVRSATLRLYGNAGSSVGYDVRSVPSNKSVNEKTITYRNAPEVSSVVAASSGPYTVGWTSVDVTSLVSAGASGVTFAVTSASPLVLSFASREVIGTPPTLDIITDTTPPSVTLTSPANGSTSGASPTYGGVAGTAVGDSATVTVSVYAGSSASGTPLRTLTTTRDGSGAYSVTGAALTDGTYTARAEQLDDAGNLGLSTANTFTAILPDTTPPAVTLTSPAGGSTTGASPTYGGVAGTVAGDSTSVTVKVYAGSSASGTPLQALTATRDGSGAYSTTGAALANGTYTAQAAQGDSSGNTGVSTANTFTVDTTAPDTTAPAVTLTSPSHGSTTSSATPTYGGVAGTVAGDSTSVTVKVYAGSSASGTPLQTLTATRDGSGAYSTTGAPLANGTYTAQAQQADSAGNTGFSTANSFTVNVPDTTAPAVTLTSPSHGSTTSSATPTYSGVAGMVAGDSTSVTVKVYAGSSASGTPLQTLTATPDGSGAYSTTGAALANGTYTAQAQQSDSAANTGFSTANTFAVSVSTGGLDTAIDFGPTGTVRSGTATFTFSSPDANAQFECALNGGAFVACSSPKTYYLPNRGHSFQVRAVTASGGFDATPAARSWWADALLQNGNFETPPDGWRLQNFVVAGWKGYNATLSLANDGVAGSAAGLVSYQSGGDYSMFSSPKPINSTIAGTIYTARGLVRSARVGKSVCMRFREYAPSGSVVGSAQKCVTTTTSWQQFPALPYAAVGSGNELEIYYYQVSATSGDSFEVDGLTIEDGSSDPSPPVASGDPVLLALADIAYCYSGGDDATARVADTIAGTIAIAGDTAYNNGATEDFAGCYNPSWGRHKDRTRPVPGDHEYGTPGAAGYWDYFGAAAGVRGKGWYSYDLGAWHIVALNSNCTQVAGCAAGSEQYEWLRADLAASSKPCTAAYFHHPLFNAGTVHGNYPTVRPFWDLLYQHGAEIVFTGDEHTYQRFAPQTPSGGADPVRGIREFIVGMGGALHYTAGNPIPNLEVVNDNTFGILKLTLHAASYDWQFVPQAGKTFTDSGTTACH